MNIKFSFAPFLVGFVLMLSGNASLATPVDTLAAGEWYEVPNSNLSAVDPCPSGNCSYSGVSGIHSVMNAWSGGAFDTIRNRLVVWGGGHTGYGGNAIFAFDIETLQWERLTNPSTSVGGNENSGLYPDGQPRSRHTYDYVEYAPNVDRFISLGGAGMYVTGQNSDSRVHAFNFDTRTWNSNLARTPVRGHVLNSLSAYDPATGLLWYRTTYQGSLSAYNPMNDTWSSEYGAGSWVSFEKTAAIDPERRLMVAVGGRESVMVWDLDNPGSAYTVQTSGNRAIESSNSPGFEYDPAIKMFVAWDGGANVYTLNPSNWQWTRITPAASNTTVPKSSETNGTYGRFRYIPSKNAYVVVNRSVGNVYFYKLSEGAGDATVPESFTLNIQ